MKRLLHGVAMLLATVVLCPAITANSPDDLGHILVLYAFGEEGKSIAGAMTVVDRDTVLGREVLIGHASGQLIVLAETGVGMTNAAMTTQTLVDRYQPRIVLLSGIAGAIDSNIQIGDITAPARWVTHDYGTVFDDSLRPGGIRAYSPAVDSVVRLSEFRADDSLLAVIEQINFDSIGLRPISDTRPRMIIGGVGVSGNQFIDSRIKREWLQRTFRAFVTDMESSSVAQVCVVNGLPFVIFRSASDLAGGSGSATARTEMDRFLDVAAHNSATVVLTYLKLLPHKVSGTGR